MIENIGIALALLSLLGLMKVANALDSRKERNAREKYADTLFADIVRVRDFAKEKSCYFARELCNRAARAHDKGDLREAETLCRVAVIELADHGYYCRVNFEAFHAA